jgi:hypothetical protein
MLLKNYSAALKFVIVNLIGTCTLQIDDNKWQVGYDEPQRAITPGHPLYSTIVKFVWAAGLSSNEK